MLGDDKEVDWTGVAPRNDPIEPLTTKTFVERLESLSTAVNAVERLRRAFVVQHPEYAELEEIRTRQKADSHQ